MRVRSWVSRTCGWKCSCQTPRSKIVAIENFARPETKKEVRTFLGLTGYYMRFIEGYILIPCCTTDRSHSEAEPPHGQVDWRVWNCFLSINGETLLGSSLKESQFQTTIHAANRRIKLGNRSSAKIEKKYLAIKLGIKAFRVYLLGRPFTIKTDHRSLTWMERLKSTID